MELTMHFIQESSLEEFKKKVHSDLNRDITIIIDFNITEKENLLSALVLHYNVTQFAKEKILYVLENGGDPNQYDENGHTSIWYALSHDTSLLQLLIDHNADINKEQFGNCLPVYLPVLNFSLRDKHNSLNIFLFLLEKGSLLEIPEKNIFISDWIDSDTYPKFIEIIHEYQDRLSPKSIAKLKEVRLQQLLF